MAARSNNKEAEKFNKEFCDIIRAEGFVPQMVFNGDETGLFWKTLPNHTSITGRKSATRSLTNERHVNSIDVW